MKLILMSKGVRQSVTDMKSDKSPGRSVVPIELI